jgi:pilus assembly protein CpaE
MARILVIDDDKDILRLLDFALQRVGHEVVTRSDGLQGLAEVEAQKPDLIVADVMMPKMTGYEFCKQVRAKPEGQDIPIIIFSARFQPIDKQTALDAGANEYLPKSISPDVLIKAINQHLPDSSLAVTSAMFGFFSLRGGSGVTSLAVNSAIALAVAAKAKTALVDLIPLGGHTALLLGVRPASSVVTALSTWDSNSTLDAIKPHLIKHSSGVQLLASTLNYDQKLSPADKRLTSLLKTIKSGFGLSIIDLPHSLDPPQAAILKSLDRIVLVLSPDVPSLQSTAMALQGLSRLDIPDRNIVLVLNQISPQSGLPIETIQNAIKRPITARIPYEPELIKAANQGKPLLIGSPKSAGAAAIGQLANKLLNS